MPKRGIREHVDPGRRRHLRRRRRDDVLAAVGRESAEVIAEHEVRARRVRAARAARGGGCASAPGAATLLSARTLRFTCSSRLPRLSEMMTRAAACSRMRSSFEICSRIADENAARPVDRVRFRAGRDQPDDLVLEPLAVADVLLVPDHEIDDQALQAPVGVAADQLARELDVRGIRDLQQHDRMIAGDRVSPETRLPALVAHEHAGVGAQRRIRVEHRTGQPPVNLRIAAVALI